jgi:hypothetical protein
MLTFAMASAPGANLSAKAADAERGRMALAVAPARLALVAPASRRLELSNIGAERVVVDVAWRSTDSRPAVKRWLRLRPAHLVLPRGSRALLTLATQAGPSPGDHQLMLVVTGRPANRSRVAVRLRLAVHVRVRAPGRLVRKVDVEGIRVRRTGRKRALLVALANRGNVTEQLSGRVTVTLARGRRLVSRLRYTRRRELFPAARAVVALPYAGRVRGALTAIVTLRRGRHAPALERRYRIRL